jgi:hypothetical protein
MYITIYTFINKNYNKLMFNTIKCMY